MKRHDTHLLSDESEKEKKEEDQHQYNFNNSTISSCSSEDKYISKKPDNKNPININMINQNYFNNNINFKEDNVSILSSKDLEDIFCNEDVINNIPQKKKKTKKNKYFIKIRKVKLNNENNDEIIDNCLTYNLTLNY